MRTSCLQSEEEAAERAPALWGLHHRDHALQVDDATADRARCTPRYEGGDAATDAAQAVL